MQHSVVYGNVVVCVGCMGIPMILLNTVMLPWLPFTNALRGSRIRVPPSSCVTAPERLGSQICTKNKKGQGDRTTPLHLAFVFVPSPTSSLLLRRHLLHIFIIIHIIILILNIFIIIHIIIIHIFSIICMMTPNSLHA